MERYTIPFVFLAGMGLLSLLGGILTARNRRGFEKLPDRAERVPDLWYRWHPQSRPTRMTGIGVLSFLISCIASMFVAFRAGVYSYLLWWYGPAQWWSDGLRVVETPKGQPWTISNGEQIPNGEWFAFLVSLPIWMILTVLLMVVIERFSPRKLEAPFDAAACAVSERTMVTGGRALMIAGGLILFSSLASLLIIWIRS